MHGPAPAAAGPPPIRLAHSYTNETTRDGVVVTKSYQGPDAARRCAHEAAVLSALAGLLPVPPVLAAAPPSLRLGFLPGSHGQELIDAGLAGPVLSACGAMLRRIHRVYEEFPERLRDQLGPGGRGVLVHGDYGPNNVLLDATAGEVVAVVDWEWAHLGDPLEDLAWCEWVVRMHHPGHETSLAAFFDAYGQQPPWTVRQRMMVTRCQEILDLCRAWQPDGDAARLWRHRLGVTASWSEDAGPSVR